jgi:hypothetical protein
VRAALVLLATLLATPAMAGPWTHGPGHGYSKAWLSLLPGIGWNGELGTAPSLYGYYQETFVGTYAELGFAPRLDATVQWTPLRTFLLVDPVDDATFVANTGEPALGVKWQLLAVKRFAMAIEGQVRFPGESNAPVATTHSMIDGAEIGALRVANGVFEAQLGLSFGLGLDAVYAAWGVHAMKRGGGFDSVLLWTAEIGLGRPMKTGWTGRVRLGGRHGLRDGTAPYHDSPSGIGNGTEYVAFTIELERLVAKDLWFGISVGGGLGPVTRQTGGPQLAISVSRRW